MWRFGLLALAMFIWPGAKYPSYFGMRPENITFRWMPGAAVHSCSDVEQRVELTCAPIDWTRDAKNKHRWVAVCGE